MILSAQSIARLCAHESVEPDQAMIAPFEYRQSVYGLTYGLSACGYDIRLSGQMHLLPSDFKLGASIECFKMPPNVMGLVKDKSSLARRGVSVFNTVIEPGWQGYLTLEIVNNGTDKIYFHPGYPIAQIVFQWLDEPTHLPYGGKYQNQGPYPQKAKYE